MRTLILVVFFFIVQLSGVYKPFKIIQKSPMELTIQYKEVEFNKDIDVNLLSKPTNK